MFSINREDFFGIEKIKLKNLITGEYVSIIPTLGSNLNELVLLNEGTLHSIISGDVTIESLNGHPINFYRGAKLSPFPNRVAVGKYTFQEEIYLLDRNDGVHALHGLIWNRPFRVVHEDIASEFVEVELEYVASEYVGYPFSYTITLLYRLDLSGLNCYTTILNTGHETMPVGDGWHPYFTTYTKVDDLKLKLPPCKQLGMDASIPTGVSVETHFSNKEVELENYSLDHCFELISTDEIATTELIDTDKNIKVVIWQEVGNNGYQFIQVYIPPDRMSIAIEPMTCAPNAFNNKKGLIELDPNEHVHIQFGIQLKSII